MVDLDVGAINRTLSTIGREINLLGGRIELVGHHVDAVSSVTAETRGELAQLKADFASFVSEAQRTAHLQRAETRRGVVQDEITKDFGHHDTVRRSATGMLQAFDIGLVSPETVKHISEQLMLDNPRYWLAPALVALAAWSNDDVVLCERAVAEAHRRDPVKCALLFALVTRRQQRLDASVRWLRHYLGAQDPARLGRDFATVLEAVSQGAFSAAARDEVQDVLSEWRSQLLSGQGTIDEQVKAWRNEVDQHVGPSRSAAYATLAAVSPEWPALDRLIAQAGAHRSLLADYGPLLTEEIIPNARLEDAVDDIVDTLVREYDVDELPKRRELARRFHGGDA